MLKISIFFDVIYWRTAVWRLSLEYTSKLDANLNRYMFDFQVGVKQLDVYNKKLNLKILKSLSS